MKFKKEWLQGILWDENEDAEIISDDIIDTSRWSIHSLLTFKFGGKFYQVTYSKSQDERPFDNDPDEIECTEVVPVAKTITVYEAASKHLSGEAA